MASHQRAAASPLLLNYQLAIPLFTASLFEHCLLYPLDTIKTRLQAFPTYATQLCIRLVGIATILIRAMSMLND
jgi:hypothetical protein